MNDKEEDFDLQGVMRDSAWRVELADRSLTVQGAASGSVFADVEPVRPMPASIHSNRALQVGRRRGSCRRGARATDGPHAWVAAQHGFPVNKDLPTLWFDPETPTEDIIRLLARAARATSDCSTDTARYNEAVGDTADAEQAEKDDTIRTLSMPTPP